MCNVILRPRVFVQLFLGLDRKEKKSVMYHVKSNEI